MGYVADLELEVKKLTVSPDVLAVLKSQLAELTEKLQRAEAALTQAQTKPEEDPGLKRRVQDLDEAITQCRKSLEQATVQTKKPASNNGGFIRYTVIPKTEAPRGANSILVGTLAN